MSKIEEISTTLRALAVEVRDNVYAREAIAKGFELIACAMSPCSACEDCGNGQAAAVIDPADNPEAGQEVGSAASAVIATTAEALANGQGEADNVNPGV